MVKQHKRGRPRRGQRWGGELERLVKDDRGRGKSNKEDVR